MLNLTMKKNIKCRLCGNTKFFEETIFSGTTILYKDSSFVYGKCSKCHSINLLSEVSIDYTNYVASKHFQKLKTRRLANFLTIHKIDKKSSILDYGCGNGSFFSAMKNKGYINIKGYEPNNPKFNKTLQSGKFSLVYLIHVFEHLTNLNFFFFNLKKATNIKSKVLILCPSATRIPKLNSKCPFQQQMIHAPFHTFIPSDKALINLFIKNKYRLRLHLPYDIVRSGFIINDNVSALLQQALGGSKEDLLNSTFIDKITSILKSPFLFFYNMFMHTSNQFVSTFIFERIG